MASFDSSDMALRGRIGGFVRASRFPKEELTRAARDGFLARFVAEVDPNGELEPVERQRRAIAARKAHMAQLAHKSALARAKSRKTGSHVEGSQS